MREHEVQSPIRPHRSSWDLVHRALDFGSVFGSFWLLTSLAGHVFGERESALALIGALVFLLLGQATGLYPRWKSPDTRSELAAIAGTWFVTTFVLLALGFLTRYGETFPRSTVLAWVLTAPLIDAGSHIVVRQVRRSARQRGIGTRHVAIAGYNRLGLEVAKGLSEEADGSTLQLVGFFDDRARERLPARQSGIPGLKGRLAELVEASHRRELDMILVTLPMRAEARIRSLLDELSDTTCSVYLVPDFFVFELLHSKWGTVGGLPAVSLFESPFYGVDGTVKRILDLTLAMLALAVAALPMAIIAVLIKLTSPGPVLFGQRRYGLDGREIRIWKFRSMRVCDDGADREAGDEARPQGHAAGSDLAPDEPRRAPPALQRARPARCRWSARGPTPRPTTSSTAG